MRAHVSFLFGLLLALAVMVSCRGGSSGLPMKVIPNWPSSGPTGGTAQFTATVTGGTPPYAYNWHFGTWATPDSSLSAAPTVTLIRTPGRYQGTLIVLDSASGMSAVPISFEVWLKFEKRDEDSTLASMTIPR